MDEEKNGGWRQIFLAIVLAVLAALPPTLVAWAALQKADETHNLVNSRMTEMLSVVKAAASAEATLKEKADEKARQGAAAEAALEQLPNRHDKELRK